MKKATKNILLMLALFGAVSITACRKDHDNYVMDNQSFVTRASSSNMFEIAAGNLAVQHSTNTSVKAFGSHMVNDHGTTGTQMATLASQKGWTIPTAMVQTDQANLNTLSSLTGTAFDKQFAAMMVTSHQQTITLFQQASSESGVRDADLRKFAGDKLPTLKEHLQEAQQLQASVGQ